MLGNTGAPVTEVPACFGVDCGKFEEKEEWSGDVGVNKERQQRCGKCPLVMACVMIHVLEKMR